MVLNCVAYGCNNLQDSRTNISFHTFPFKRPEILKLWINAIRRENWNPSKTSRICEKHFLETDYKMIFGSNRKALKLDAVPSIFSFPKHLMKTKPSRRILKRHIPYLKQEKTENSDVFSADIPSMSSTISSVNVENCVETIEIVDTQTVEEKEDVSVLQMKRKIKTLQQKIRRRNEKITNMEYMLKRISESR